MKVFAVLVLAVAAAGCTQAQYESEPVAVQTAKGPVTCQLYGHNQVVWDEAILRPDSMTDDEANQVCVQEGQRRLAAY
ncbi:hypothetical protein FEV53_05390 [Palleronia caenipelagi]|uniref:DUF4156 domain-containing protein n=1 Tax=Palleronia caenipelagi TaxID=2489174 RepID=A0A547Q703_9RHOB|nr:hypothetical protein FEV53_05390 [Palleronia caenipelagi]